MKKYSKWNFEVFEVKVLKPMFLTLELITCIYFVLAVNATFKKNASFSQIVLAVEWSV